MRGRKANQQGAKTGGPDENVWRGRRTRRSGSGRRTKRGGKLAATMAAVVLCTAAGAWGIDSSAGGGQGLVGQEFKQLFASTPLYEWLQPERGKRVAGLDSNSGKERRAGRRHRDSGIQR